MMKRTVLQVPVSKELRMRAEKSAANLGFSSLQEIIRVFMTKLAKKEVMVSVELAPVKLSNRAVKRYDKILDDIKKGKDVYKAKDVDDLMEQLDGDRVPRKVS